MLPGFEHHVHQGADQGGVVGSAAQRARGEEAQYLPAEFPVSRLRLLQRLASHLARRQGRVHVAGEVKQRRHRAGRVEVVAHGVLEDLHVPGDFGRQGVGTLRCTSQAALDLVQGVA